MRREQKQIYKRWNPHQHFANISKWKCVPLTDCINSSILNGSFPNDLRIADVVPVFKKDEPFDKFIYSPIGLLPSLSKFYGKLIYRQLNAFREKKLSPLLCGFRSGHGTKHASLNLFNKWQSYFDKSGVLNTILMDLHCVKSVLFRIFSGPHFPVFVLNTEIYRVNIRIQSKWGKIRTSKTLVMDTFHTVLSKAFYYLPLT